MPKIPQANNEARINVGATPRISMPEMGVGAASKSAQAQNEVTQALANAEDVLIRVRDFRQQTEAQNFTFERLNEIKSRSEQDNNFNSTPYETEIDKVGQEATKTITGRLAKEEFMAGFQKQSIAAKWGIKNDFRARELKSIDASIDYQAQQIIDNYGGMNDAERMTNVANYRKSLENGVKIGLYNKATAEAKYAKFQKDVFRNEVKYDIYNDKATQEENSLVLAELKKGEKGKYSFLTSAERLELIQESQRRIFHNNQMFKNDMAETKKQNLENMWDKAISGILNFKDIDDARKIPEEAGGIPKSQLENFQKGLENYYKNDLKLVAENNDSAKKYIDLVNTYIDDKFDRNRALEKLGEAYADRNINNEEAKFLKDLSNTLTDMAYNKARAKIIYPIRNIQAFFSKEYPKDNKILALKLKELLGDTIKGGDPQAIVTAIIDEQTEKKLADFNKGFGKRISVIRISDGAEGNILESDFDPTKYEKK